MSIGNVLSDLFDQFGDVGPIVGGFLAILATGIIGAVFQIDLSKLNVLLFLH